jgi:hypothetical protein
MNDVEKHCQTKLDIKMYQIGELFDSCNNEKKLNVISAIINDAVDNGEEVPMTIDDIRSLFTELTDEQRLELIKSIIWTSPDMHSFYKKVYKTINSANFKGTLC